MGQKTTVTEIIYLPLDEIHEYENNPRNNDKAVAEVVKSIKLYGVRRPAIIDKDNVLLAGHTRIKAARQLGMTEFPCVRADDLTKNEGKAYRLADNRTQEDSQWDIEALKKEFDALKANGFDLTNTGFDEFEIQGIDMSSYDYSEDDGTGEEYDDDTPESDIDEYIDVGLDEDEDQMDDNTTTTCILACDNEDDENYLRQLIRETGELKNFYNIKDIKQRFESEINKNG